jgi:hypothetical protein
MREQERRAFEDQEPFQFYMNAFLCAASTLRDCFRYGQDKSAMDWKRTWEAKLTPQEKGVYDFLGEDRNAELHRAGSSRKAKVKTEEFAAGSYSFAPGTTEIVVAPPEVQVAMRKDKKVYTITIAGTERVAIEACAEYAALLERLIADYQVTR